jgi:hypothetical protein
MMDPSSQTHRLRPASFLALSLFCLLNEATSPRLLVTGEQLPDGEKELRMKMPEQCRSVQQQEKIISVAFSPQANYTD